MSLPPVTFSDDQAAAYDSISEMLRSAGVDLDDDALLKLPGNGKSGVMAVIGKAGSGKTLLLAELYKALAETGVQIVSGDFESRKAKRSNGKSCGAVCGVEPSAHDCTAEQYCHDATEHFPQLFADACSERIVFTGHQGALRSPRLAATRREALSCATPQRQRCGAHRWRNASAPRRDIPRPWRSTVP